MRFQTYGQLSRRERDRRNKARKADIRSTRMQALRNREDAPVSARVNY